MPAPGAVHSAPPGRGAGLAARGRRKQSRSDPDLEPDDDQREAGGTRRALGSGWNGGHGGLGFGGGDRRKTAVPIPGPVGLEGRGGLAGFLVTRRWGVMRGP